MTDTDWDILDDERVESILTGASRKVAEKHNHVVEPDDLYQDGAVLLAGNAELIREKLQNPLIGQRGAYRWLYSKLTDSVKTLTTRAGKQDSYGLHIESNLDDDDVARLLDAYEGGA